MLFTETKLAGAFIVEPEWFEDERGFFSLIWSANEFKARGLDADFAECNISYNKRKGTLRGMHFQKQPYAQAKLVRCTMGSVYDVIIDLRPTSPTFRQWVALELSATNRLMIFVPKDFAHGFQTLEDDSEICYQMSSVYVPESGSGVRWNDPAFGIDWPDDERIIVARDLAYPDFVG